MEQARRSTECRPIVDSKMDTVAPPVRAAATPRAQETDQANGSDSASADELQLVPGEHTPDRRACEQPAQPPSSLVHPPDVHTKQEAKLEFHEMNLQSNEASKWCGSAPTHPSAIVEPIPQHRIPTAHCQIGIGSHEDALKLPLGTFMAHQQLVQSSTLASSRPDASTSHHVRSLLKSVAMACHARVPSLIHTLLYDSMSSMLSGVWHGSVPA